MKNPPDDPSEWNSMGGCVACRRQIRTGLKDDDTSVTSLLLNAELHYPGATKPDRDSVKS
jgi:hypothetical protein